MANGKTTPSTQASPPTTQTLLPQTRIAGMPFVAELVPDNTAAVFVVNPKPYWDKLKYETVVGQHLKDYAGLLHRLWNFDPWRFDRVTLAFESNPKRFFAIGEGDLLRKTDFSRGLNDIKRFNMVTEADGTLLMREKIAIGTKRDDTRAIFLPKPLAYFIGTPTVNLSEVLKNLRGGSTGLKNQRLQMVLGDAGITAHESSNDQYLAYFAATGDFQFHPKPGSSLTSLNSHGVDALSARVAFDGNFHIIVTALGTKEKMLSTFLEHELPDVFEQHDREEGGKEIAKLIRLATEHSTTGDLQQYKSRTIQFDVDWLVAHSFLAKMIDTTAATLKK